MPASSNNNEAEKVNVGVRGQDDRILYFKINGTVRLSKMFAIYCERRQLEVQTVQFLYEGNRITGNQTPHGLHLGFMIFVATCSWDWRTVPKSVPLSTSLEAEDSSTVAALCAERLLSAMRTASVIYTPKIGRCSCAANDFLICMLE
ncbi:hypothetical protein NL676_021704 [Syzygium grande]|nr:hypothetical protein NL676_021704 [Syzygium grande]